MLVLLQVSKPPPSSLIGCFQPQMVTPTFFFIDRIRKPYKNLKRRPSSILSSFKKNRVEFFSVILITHTRSKARTQHVHSSKSEENKLQVFNYDRNLLKILPSVQQMALEAVEFTAEKNHLFHFLTYRWRYCCAPRKTLQKCLKTRFYLFHSNNFFLLML